MQAALFGEMGEGCLQPAGEEILIGMEGGGEGTVLPLEAFYEERWITEDVGVGEGRVVVFQPGLHDGQAACPGRGLRVVPGEDGSLGLRLQEMDGGSFGSALSGHQSEKARACSDIQNRAGTIEGCPGPEEDRIGGDLESGLGLMADAKLFEPKGFRFHMPK